MLRQLLQRPGLAGALGALRTPSAVARLAAAAGLACTLAASAAPAPAVAAEALRDPAAAEPNRWTPLGPDGGEVLSLLVDPLDAGVVYAGTGGGNVFVSRDGGGTWRLAGEGLFASRVDDLAIAATASSPLYAATDRGVFRLPGGGGEWLPASDGLPALREIGEIEIDPGDPSTLYLTGRDGTSSYSLFVSTDAASSWRRVQAGIRAPIAIAPTAPPTLYLAYSGGVRRSTDGGESSTASSFGRPFGVQITDLLVDPATPTTLYAATEEYTSDPHRVYKSTDGGVSWAPADAGLEEGLPGGGIPFLRWLAADPLRQGTLYFGGPEGVFKSVDGALTWSPVNSAPADRVIFALAVDAAGDAVFAGASRFGPEGDVGVLRSTDGGASWQPLTAGLAASSISSLLPHPTEPGRLLVGTDGRGVQRSEDGGASWAAASSGIDEPSVGPLTRDPSTPSTLYAVAGDARHRLTRVYRSTDSAATWQDVGPELESRFGGVAVDPLAPTTLYLPGDKLVFRSLDRGESWEQVSRWVGSRGLRLAAGPGYLLVAWIRSLPLPGDPPASQAEIYRSVDGGRSFQRVLEGPSQTVNAEWTLSLDPAAGVAYAGLVSGTTGEIFRTCDGGVTWEAIGPPGEAVQAVLADPVDGSHLFAGTARSGVLHSVDGGDTWAPFNHGLGAADVRALAVDPTAPGTLLAGTGGGGVFSLRREPAPHPPSEPAVCSPSDRTLHLAGGRFRVEVEWRDFRGGAGTGRATALTDSTGVFSFFHPGNPELAVKILDGRTVNGRFWVFRGGLSNVGYTLTVTDAWTRLSRSYENPPRRLASGADLRTFEAEYWPPLVAAPAAESVPGAASRAPIAAAAEVGTPLELHGGRFEVTASWEIPGGAGGFAHGEVFSDHGGTFWFFSPGNRELAVKVLDGRVVNGHFWVFIGSLTNVHFLVGVEDTETGTWRFYRNPAGTIASYADLEAF